MCVLFFIYLFSVILSFKLFFVFILHIFLVLLFSHGFIYWWFECLNCFLPLLYLFEDYSTSHYFVLKSNASFSFSFKFFSLVLSSCFIRIFINISRFSSLSLISLSSNLDLCRFSFLLSPHDSLVFQAKHYHQSIGEFTHHHLLFQNRGTIIIPLFWNNSWWTPFYSDVFPFPSRPPSFSSSSLYPFHYFPHFPTSSFSWFSSIFSFRHRSLGKFNTINSEQSNNPVMFTFVYNYFEFHWALFRSLFFSSNSSPSIAFRYQASTLTYFFIMHFIIYETIYETINK